MWNDEKSQLLRQLSPDYPWRDRIVWVDTLDSTNQRLKLLARQGAQAGTAVFAQCQTGGRGRMGRSFHSPAGAGIYLSFLLRLECRPQALMHLTCAVAVSMCHAVEKSAGFRPGIKWTNDLVYRERKLGGILTELGLTPQGNVDYAILGIGINCSQAPGDFPPEIAAMAGSVTMAAGKPVDRSRVAAAMLEALWALDGTLLTGREEILSRYRQDCVTLGRDISVLRGDTVRHGRALDVDSDGALLVQYDDGTREAVNSGEVSVRGMYGYL